MRDLVKLPAPRYWCSETQAVKFIVDKLHGNEPKKTPLPQRKRMYDNLFQRYVKEKESRPNDSVYDIMLDVVNSPAPESYLTPESVKVIISTYRKEKREANKNIHSRALRNAAAIIHLRAERNGTIPRTEQPVGMDEPSDVHDSACVSDPCADKLICVTDNDIPCQGKIVAIDSKRFNCFDHTKYINRKHTNVRHIRAQLRISWDPDA